MTALDIAKRRAAEAERNRKAMPITTRWVHQVREGFPDAKVKRVTEAGQSLGKPSGDYEVKASDMVLHSKSGRVIHTPKTLFNPEPYCRRSDPETSVVAAENVDNFKAAHDARIFDAIWQVGNYGATAKEIAPVARLTDVQVSRRLSGMEERKLIVRRLKENPKNDRDFIERGGCAVWWANR